MRHYEILLLIHPDQSSQVSAMLDRYQSIIAKGAGKIHRQEDWGKLQLAYQINKLHKAHYVLLNIECEKNTLLELGNAFKFNDAVIRNLITNCETAITEPSIFFKNKDNKDFEKSYNNRDNRENSNYSGGYYEQKTNNYHSNSSHTSHSTHAVETLMPNLGSDLISGDAE